MPATQLHSPYIYLNSPSVNLYDLFVLVPYQEGETVTIENTDYTNGTTFVTIKVIGSPNDPNSQVIQFPIYLQLDPVNETGGVSFDPSTFSIEVQCKKHEDNNGVVTVSTLASRMFYEDADDVLIPANGNIAFNCPYLYLLRPGATEGFPGGYEVEFDPYCLVPLENATYQASQFQVVQHATNYRQEIIFQPLNNGAQNQGQIDPDDIPSNMDTYVDQDEIDGFYAARVSSSTNDRPKRKGRIRNIDSDTNPNSFIDRSPFF